MISKLDREILMNRLLALIILAAALFISAAQLSADHGRGATYDMKKQITLKGTVTEVAWRNPHVAVYMDVKDPSGNLVHWAFENSNVSTLSRQGYNRNTLKVGEEVTAIVNPSAQGAPRGLVVKVILPDGKEVFSRERGNPVD